MSFWDPLGALAFQVIGTVSFQGHPLRSDMSSDLFFESTMYYNLKNACLLWTGSCDQHRIQDTLLLSVLTLMRLPS